MSVPNKPPLKDAPKSSGLLSSIDSFSLKERGGLWLGGAIATALIILFVAISEYWSREPPRLDVLETAVEEAKVQDPKELPLGYTYATALIDIAQTLLHKPGGFLSNDMFPPGVFQDNIPSWEYGALTALRDGTSALRNHIARAQSQSKEDADLGKAEPFFYFDHRSWQLPSSESEYDKGIEAMEHYRERLVGRDAQFYSRADNLRQYLEILEKRLGSLSNRLSASAGDSRQMSTEENRAIVTRTSWINIDDVFFEARGYCWATIHILRAVEFDFRDILGNKTALVSLQSIIHELEDGQAPYLSPVILNGGGFGLFANYSLTLANYIARANAATIDLRNLLQQG
ncbi:DUF2333 family protein [Methylococcus sp. EFPC2]|uniref:DUF2333 family protein n=1 Tax=Methylococcus sp. EFPC2 TaxID=2812648 RepID=UPI00196787EB|nr:DUF2333 family protein [Methylococcus sp. EFPC2]QSA96730.1 DUF2333 family protein [Methylococcus sp. EFPC2]